MHARCHSCGQFGLWCDMRPLFPAARFILLPPEVRLWCETAVNVKEVMGSVNIREESVWMLKRVRNFCTILHFRLMRFAELNAPSWFKASECLAVSFVAPSCLCGGDHVLLLHLTASEMNIWSAHPVCGRNCSRVFCCVLGTRSLPRGHPGVLRIWCCVCVPGCRVMAQVGRLAGGWQRFALKFQTLCVIIEGVHVLK